MAKTKILIIHNKYRNLGGEDLTEFLIAKVFSFLRVKYLKYFLKLVG